MSDPLEEIAAANRQFHRRPKVVHRFGGRSPFVIGFMATLGVLTAVFVFYFLLGVIGGCMLGLTIGVR